MLYKSLQVSTEESLTPESATCLVKWADEYQIENVKAKCEQFLLSQPVNAQSLQLAVKYVPIQEDNAMPQFLQAGPGETCG